MLPRQNLIEKKQILRERYLLEREIELFIRNGLNDEAVITHFKYKENQEQDKKSVIKKKLYQQTVRDSSEYQSHLTAVNQELTRKIQKAQSSLKSDKVEVWKEQWDNLELLRSRFKLHSDVRHRFLEREILQIQTDLQTKIQAKEDVDNKCRDALLKDVLQVRKKQVSDKKIQKTILENEKLFERKKIEQELQEFRQSEEQDRQTIKNKQEQFRSSLDMQVKEKNAAEKLFRDKELNDHQQELETLEYEKEWLRKEIVHLNDLL